MGRTNDKNEHTLQAQIYFYTVYKKRSLGAQRRDTVTITWKLYLTQSVVEDGKYIFSSQNQN